MRKFVVVLSPSDNDGFPIGWDKETVQCYAIDHLAAMRQVLVDTKPLSKRATICGICNEVEPEIAWGVQVKFKARSIVGLDGVTGWTVKIEGNMVVGN